MQKTSSWWTGGALKQGQGMILQKEGKIYFACLAPNSKKQMILPDDEPKGKKFQIFCQNGKFEDKIMHIKYVPVKAAQIQAMVDQGHLLLFQIHHRHLYKNKKNPDRIVSVFKELLLETNSTYWLSPNSVLTWRKAVVPKGVAHPAGSLVVNKKDYLGQRIPEKAYQQLRSYYNDEISMDSLPEEVKSMLQTVKVKQIQKDIVKDKRYTTEKFFFSCTIKKHL